MEEVNNFFNFNFYYLQENTNNEPTKEELNNDIMKKQEKSIMRVTFNSIEQNVCETLKKVSGMLAEKEKEHTIEKAKLVEDTKKKCEEIKKREIKNVKDELNYEHETELAKINKGHGEIVKDLQHNIADLTRLASDNEKEWKRYEELYYKERERRKKAEQDLMDIRGNIRVFCRVRPILPVEINQGDCRDTCTYPLEGDIAVRV